MQFGRAAAAGKWNERWGWQGMMYVNYLRKVGAGMPGMWCPGAWRGTPAMPAMPPHLDWQGHPKLTTTRPVTRHFSALQWYTVTTWGWILTSSSFQLGPSIKFWLCLAGRGPSCGAPNYWPLSPAQFETNHPKTRWASGGRWRMEENTNSEIQSQDWYNQVADKKKSKRENLEKKRKLNLFFESDMIPGFHSGWEKKKILPKEYGIDISESFTQIDNFWRKSTKFTKSCQKNMPSILGCIYFCWDGHFFPLDWAYLDKWFFSLYDDQRPNWKNSSNKSSVKSVSYSDFGQWRLNNSIDNIYI